tara:strand:+ start:2141 stop:2461 length:321 start_codon:yes stop_codon:yes gene_type:complete
MSITHAKSQQSKTMNIKEQKRDILNPTKAEINLLVQGSVASGNIGSHLKELARLDIETTLLKKHLRFKQALLNVTYNDLLREATHEWTIDVDLRLEDTDRLRPVSE